jgi:hypothetical protein
MVDHMTRNIFEATKKEHLANPGNAYISSANGELLEDMDYITLDPTPIFSKAHNALGLGRSFRKTKNVTEPRQALYQSGPILLPSQKSVPTNKFPISASVSPPSFSIPSGASDPLSALLGIVIIMAYLITN